MDSTFDYPKEVLNRLDNMREHGQLCDINVCVGNKSFPAHKTVLAATGDYFLKMFTSGFRESSENKITIDGSAEAFQIFLEFAYTGDAINMKQISSCSFEAVEMACYTQFTKFAEACSSAIEDAIDCEYNISVSDVCKIMLLAEKHSYLKHLHEISLQHLEDHVGDLKSLDIFLEHTSMSLLQAFLSRDTLSDEDEEKEVLELVINWLKHDWEKRKSYSHQLLQKVRLALVDSEDIKELIGQEILDIPECLELVNHVLQLQASKKPRDVLSIENPEIAATRSTVTAPVMSREGTFQFYAAQRNEWIDLMDFAPLPSKTARFSMIVVDNILYALGGKDGTEFHSYQTGENKWQRLPSMSRQQKYIKVVSLAGSIYSFAILREDDDEEEEFYPYYDKKRKRHDLPPEGSGILVERYDIAAKKWEAVEPPPDNWQNDLQRAHINPESGPNRKQYISVLVFEGKILVSSVSRIVGRRNRNAIDRTYVFSNFEDFLIYDPEKENWQIKEIRGEQVEQSSEMFVEDPLLFTYKDELYQTLDYNDRGWRHDISVNRVIYQTQDDGTVKVTMGEKLSQEALKDPGKCQLLEYPWFRIGDNAFSIKEGVVCVMGKLSGKSKGQNLGLEPGNSVSFPDFSTKKLSSTPVWFTFDRKKLQSEYYYL